MKKGKQNCLMIQMPPATSTIEEGKKYLRANWDQNNGVDCPCCGQLVKLYNRKLYSKMALQLIALYRLDRKHPNQYFHITDIGVQTSVIGGGDFAKLKYWGLIVELEKDDADDTKRTSGHWAITQKGRDFVIGKITVPSHVKVFDGRTFGFGEKHITIHHALGKKFNYAELMGDAMHRHDAPENGRLL